MKISDYSGNSSIERFLEEYDCMTSCKEISPIMVTSFDVTCFYRLNCDGKYIRTITDEDKTGKDILKSVALCITQNPEDDDDLEWTIDMTINRSKPGKNQFPIGRKDMIEGIRYHSFRGNITFIDKIESFEERKGYGKKLLSSIMNGTETIYLESTRGSIGFYSGTGFYATGIFNSNGHELMAWHNPHISKTSEGIQPKDI